MNFPQRTLLRVGPLWCLLRVQHSGGMGNRNQPKIVWRWVTRIGLFLACTYVLLLIPERGTHATAGAARRPFMWSRAQFWASLEHDFVEARRGDPAMVSNHIDRLFRENRRLLTGIADSRTLDPKWLELETNLFKLAPLIGADRSRLPEFSVLVNHIRREAKQQSMGWDLTSDSARTALYRLLFGCRMALEEVVLQHGEAAAPLPTEFDPEPSETASVVFRGVTLRSGDILMSRGAAPTSALISRGNDYMGAFSHVSLLHVDPGTGGALVVQALIEKGVVVTPLSDYTNDLKLRLIVLRPRRDLPPIVADPGLPHKVAASALRQALARHIPYDFAMDYRDHSTLFCSEVVSAAYERYGIRLWTGLSHISSPTIAAWLSSLGVRHFETQEPADLEYDPQLRVVAEWRDGAALWQAHLDDAVTDAMIENAQPGQPLPFNLFKLPLARAVKAYSVVRNGLGGLGPIPEGMSATTALRADKYRADHAAVKRRLRPLAGAFRRAHQYSPPYWQLVQLANQAAVEMSKRKQSGPSSVNPR
jgi:hypothetical protein